MVNAISFFAGAGGLDMGMHSAGFNIKLSVEIEKVFCDTLKTNHPHWNTFQGDIMKLDSEDIYRLSGIPEDDEIDLFLGGSPCQSFSTAGKRQAFDSPGGQAMLRYAELISEVQPKAFLLENVRGLLSASLKHRPIDKRGGNYPPLLQEEERGSALTHILEQFSGYNINYKLLNAANYGVPQTRERVFIVGIREDLKTEFEFPSETHSKNGEDGTNKWVTIKEALDNMHVENHNYQSYSAERLKYMKMIPTGGGNWRDLRAYGEDIVKQAMGGAFESGGGKVGFYRRLDINKPSPTLVTSPAQKSTNLGHPYEDRPLSIEEYKAIQGFPENYFLAGRLLNQYKQVGNAVPVLLAEVLGREILNTIKKVDQYVKV